MRGIDELDHYELLETRRGATPAEIDRAYRTAQQTYADGSLALYSVFENLDARAIRERLDDAYRVLSDPELRIRYDELLKEETPIAAVPVENHDGGESSHFSSGGVGQTPAERRMRGAMDGALDAGSFDDVVEEYDAIEDDGAGEFDGIRLRKNRLFRGYEIDDITQVTKVNGTHLRNIEDENFNDLPADVYVRGFVTAYAQTIGLDPKIVVPSYMARVQDARGGNQRGRFLARG